MKKYKPISLIDDIRINLLALDLEKEISIKFNQALRRRTELIDDELRFLLAILQKRAMGFNCVRCDELIKNRIKELNKLKDKKECEK